MRESLTSFHLRSPVTDLAVKERRPNLLFKHFPKCAGSYAKGLMDAAVPGHKLEPESGSVTKKSWIENYVISVIREPCDWYVSLWAFGSSQHGKLYVTFTEKEPDDVVDYYGESPPYQNPADIAKFEKFVTGKYTRGDHTARFLSSFSEVPWVDCWINTANLAEDALSCLRAFEEQGGQVHWDRVNAFLDSRRKLAAAGRANTSPHGPCQSYYSADLANYMRNESFDAPMYDYFQWADCCGGHCCPICGIDLSANQTTNGLCDS
mmetsp:Transcript_4881/g.12586  ORF Transcript_4881/g.12586 Transcript_4881/m.12586 type:complete len:264 (+) Transcript_4881:238-1029(+)